MDYQRPVNVLIIDDDNVNNFILETLITKIAADTELNICLDGERAIDHLLDLIKRDARYPDFIFVDISMPIMNGWAFLDQYIHYGLDKILKSKVFIATSSIFKRDYDMAFGYAIVEDLIVKPFSLTVLREIFSARPRLV